MIKIEKEFVEGFEPAISGMRNPMNSWEKSDSYICGKYPLCVECPHDDNGACWLEDEIGPNDHDLMMRLAAGGPVHAKYRRMIVVWVDITAPLYWWKEFDTYKVGTVANSCSTMHKIQDKEFTLDDFSHEQLIESAVEMFLEPVIKGLNVARNMYLDTGKTSKAAWWQMIQLLPSSYNQKRTVMLNYEVLRNIYVSRKSHKLGEWREFCDWIKTLPYSEIIILEENKDEESK